MLSGYWWWFLKLRFWRRLKLYKSLPYDKYMEFLGSADFYLDSYPMGGGTAFVEQYSRGFPCSGLVSPVQGYSPAERLKVRSLEELSELIRKGGHDFDSQLHDDVLYVHGMEEGKKRYLGALYDGALFRNEALQRTPYSGDPYFMEKEKISTISDAGLWLFGRLKLREQLNLFLHFLLAVDYPAMFWNQGHLASQKILIRLVTGAKKSLFFVRRVLRRG